MSPKDKIQQKITATQLAKMLGISHVAVYKKIKNGTIKAKKEGRNFVIDHEQVPEILGMALSEQLKEQIAVSVKKIVQQYGDTLRLLGKE